VRSKALVVGLVLAIGAWLAPPASAVTTTIGQPAPSGATGSCLACSVLQVTTNPASPTYAVPAFPAGESWTVTSWTVRGGSMAGGARLQVWRPTTTPNEFRLVAATPDATIAANAVPPIPASVPVQPGDVLGMRTDNANSGLIASEYGGLINDNAFTVGGDPAVGQTEGAITSNFPSTVDPMLLVNVSATLTSSAGTSSTPSSTTSTTNPTPPPVTRKTCKRKRKRAGSAKRCKKRKH
jgi:hypothetical protein